MDTWTVRLDGCRPETLAAEESLFALGNGYVGWRGNLEEGTSVPLGVNGCYINGFHETEKIRYGEIAYAYAEESQTLLNVTDSQHIRLCADGQELRADKAASMTRVLDMKRGLSVRDAAYRLPDCTVHLRAERLLSLTRPHLAAIRLTLWSDKACLAEAVPYLNGDVTNLTVSDDPRIGSGLRGRVLSAARMEDFDGSAGMSQHTSHTGLALACAMACRLAGRGGQVSMNAGRVEEAFGFRLLPDQKAVLCKYVAYAGGTLPEEAELLKTAAAEAQEAARIGFDALLGEQERFMADFWDRAGLWFEGDDSLLQGLRFNSFQLLQSAGRDGRTNIAAKGLTGEGYEGHYFWDTETYILPFFLAVMPETAKQLLTYRYEKLPLARERARQMGHPVGALFPWRTIDGREASAYYPAGTAQVHIDADIAFAVRRYWLATGDDDFLRAMGAEIVIETARFFRDLGFYLDGRFRIHEVTGPDEYNALVDNNAYTNIMAAINLSFAADTVDYLAQTAPEALAALREKIGLQEEEPAKWRAAAKAMYIPRDEKSGLIWQDDGFMNRVPWPLESIPREHFPLLLHYHPLVIYRHRVCKQADTVLAMLLAPERFTKEEMLTAFDYYDSVTTHDSSLSMAAFSAVASRVGRMDKAWAYFRGTARLDLDDTHGNTRDGLHMANMAGTWVCLVYGFGGMRLGAQGLSFDPVLPSQLKGYGFRVTWHGRLIDVHVTAAGPVYRLLRGEALDILDRGEKLHLTPELA